jgi:MerR family mercuric resistance operon transcriptional regulator
MSEAAFLFIGELAARVGVNRETLRYYERRGLLKPTRRTSSGYRVYDAVAAGRLRFIKRAQSFGLSLDEISELLGLRPNSAASCSRVLEILDRKLAELDRQIAEMKRFHRQLSRYRNLCREAIRRGQACPLIHEVSGIQSETQRR